MKTFEKSGSKAIGGRDALLPDALAEFWPERPAPTKPVAPCPAPRPGPVEARRAIAVAAARPAPRFTSPSRGRVWFALGVVLGVLLSVIGAYWLTISELPQPEPVSRAPVEIPPAAEPSILAADEQRDSPLIENTSLAPAAPKVQDVRRVVVPPPVEAPTIKPFVGSLQIDSTPQGARVFIDRKEAGITPLVVTDLVAGSHVVRLEAEGHTPWSTAIRVVANRQTDVTTILAPSLDSASVRP